MSSSSTEITARNKREGPTEALEVENQNVRGQIRAVPLRQDQKAHIVGHQREATQAEGRAPANPGIARGALQCGRTPAQQRDPLILQEGNLAERLADNRTQAEVMVDPHELPPSLPLLPAHRADDDPREPMAFRLVHAGRPAKPRANCQSKMTALCDLTLLTL